MSNKNIQAASAQSRKAVFICRLAAEISNGSFGSDLRKNRFNDVTPVSCSGHDLYATIKRHKKNALARFNDRPGVENSAREVTRMRFLASPMNRDGCELALGKLAEALAEQEIRSLGNCL